MLILENPTEDVIIKQVARLHKIGIKKGFLSFLGQEFLECMYKAISLSKDGVLLVCLENNKVVGFVSATLNISGIKKSINSRCKFILVKIILRFLLRPTVLKKVIELYMYTSAKRQDAFSGAPELLSIVVDPDYRGKGVGKILYERLLLYFRKNNVKYFKIVVGKDLLDAQNFYERMGAKKVGEFELHKGKKSYIYVHRM